MIDTIICGSTLDTLKQMESESIDCVITSPPYWGLRSYSTDGQVWGGSLKCSHEWLTGKEKVIRGTSTRIENSFNQATYKDIRLPSTDTCQLCNAWRGELGLEPTFQHYIEHLQTIFDAIYRVLKKTGTCFVNLGDTYSGAKAGNTNGSTGVVSKCGNSNSFKKPKSVISDKSLCNIPFRFAISMTDNGWIQRNTIIWHKPSCMPSSAKDRFTVDFEYVFLFSKSKRYYFEQQFEDLAEATVERSKHHWDRSACPKTVANEYHGSGIHLWNGNDKRGRNKRTVWRINPQPFKDAHFAVFPEKLVEPMIKAGCPSLVCDNCNKPYTVEHEIVVGPPVGKYNGQSVKDYLGSGIPIQDASDVKRRCMESARKQITNTEYKPQCDCDAPTHAGIVLDPFSGSGTTCLVARKLQRHYIGIDLQPDYCKMAEKRLAEVL